MSIVIEKITMTFFEIYCLGQTLKHIPFDLVNSHQIHISLKSPSIGCIPLLQLLLSLFVSAFHRLWKMFLIRSFTHAGLLLPPLFSHQATPTAPGHVWLPGPACITADLNTVLSGDERAVSLLCPSLLTPLPASRLFDINKWTGPVWSRDTAPLFEFWIKSLQQCAEYRDKWENITRRDHAVLSFGHAQACEIVWPIAFKRRPQKGKHYITSRLRNKRTPSELKRSKLTLHQTGTFHIHSLFLTSSP